MKKSTKILLIFSIIFLILAIVLAFFLNNYNGKSKEISKSPEANSDEFTFYDLDKNKYTLEDFPREEKVIFFWNRYSPNAVKYLGYIEKYYNDYKDRMEFIVINTNENSENIEELISSFKYSFKSYIDYDNKASEEFSFTKMPTFVFLGKNEDIFVKEGEITEDAYLANLDLVAENY